MIKITKNNVEDFENEFLCPKCGEGTDTYRHPHAKRWCPSCGYVLRQEGDSSKYNYKEHLEKEKSKVKCIKCGKELTSTADVDGLCTKCRNEASAVVFGNYGWICPVCGRGLSPYTTQCPCTVQQFSYTINY